MLTPVETIVSCFFFFFFFIFIFIIIIIFIFFSLPLLSGDSALTVLHSGIKRRRCNGSAPP